jgi:RIO-like serine/threonine protein kinase
MKRSWMEIKRNVWWMILDFFRKVFVVQIENSKKFDKLRNSSDSNHKEMSNKSDPSSINLV